MIFIDNAVELTVKTYLSLPRRVTGVKLSRKEFESISDSFPALVDASMHTPPEEYPRTCLAGTPGTSVWRLDDPSSMLHQSCFSSARAICSSCHTCSGLSPSVISDDVLGSIAH